MIVLRQVWAGEIAEIVCRSSALSQSLDVWMLLRCSPQVGLHQILSAQRILVQGEVEEGLLLVQVSSAFSVLEGECRQNVLKPI